MKHRLYILLISLVLVSSLLTALHATEYGVRDLGIPLDMSVSTIDINDRGQVLITAFHSEPSNGPNIYLWSRNTGLVDITEPDEIFFAWAINDVGQIAGYKSVGLYNDCVVIREPDGHYRSLIQPQGKSSVAYDINNTGQVVGFADDGETHPVFWDSDGTAIQIAGDEAPPLCYAAAINDAGYVAWYGSGDTGGGVSYIWNPISGSRQLPALEGAYDALVSDINNSGQAVGGSGCHAVRWDSNGNVVDLGEYGSIASINNYGIMAGSINHRAVLWDTTGNPTYLGMLYGAQTSTACAINDNGWMAGVSYDAAGTSRAVLWEPVPEPSSLLSVLAGLLFVCRKSRFKGRKDNRVTKTRPKAQPLIFACATLLAVCLAIPAMATDWGNPTKTYSGISHEIDCYYPPHELFLDWGSTGANSNVYCTCSSTCTALAFTSGKITVTLTWTGGGTPPDYVWIEETSDAVWWALADYGVPWSIVNGWSKASTADTYQREAISGRPYDQKWHSKGERKVRVSASSGVITRTASFIAITEARSSNNQCGHAQSYPQFDVVITTAPSGSEIPAPVVSPPYRSPSPVHPITPEFYPPIGGSQSGGDPVDLATGAHLYLPSPDISVYNPYGPSVAYQRNHLSYRAHANYASLGLTTGWVDNYDVRLTPESPSSWGALRLTYPNGAYELLTPILDNNQPTGEFTEPNGVPYYVIGVPSGTTGLWDSVDIIFKDQTKWTFDSPTSNTYMLGHIANSMGRFISIQRVSGTDHRVTSVIDDSSPANTLMTFAYDGSDRLSSITDVYGRKAVYTYGSAAGTTCLLSVSQIVTSGTSNPPAGFNYGYESVDGHPQLSSVSFPSPTGTGISTQMVNYAYDDMRSTYVVSSLVDANSNQHVFHYESNKATRVQVKNAQGTVVDERIENFDIANGNRSTGNVLEKPDGSGGITPLSAALQYEDTNNPTLPTRMVDRNGKLAKIVYDEFGNVLTATSPRGTTTTYTYNYDDFPLGRLTSIQEGDKPATSLTYYEPSGKLHTITGPKPGTSGGSETVTIEFTYDSLGNVLTKVAPGNNAAQTITTTYNYTTDGSYTQSAKIGQPLTITDQLGHVTHLRYDSRGNVTESVDALGNTTNFTYNIADQLSDVIHP